MDHQKSLVWMFGKHCLVLVAIMVIQNQKIFYRSVDFGSTWKWKMLGPQSVTQLLSQLIMWQVLSSEEKVGRPCGSTPPPLITHHVASCSKSCVIVCGSNIAQRKPREKRLLRAPGRRGWQKKQVWVGWDRKENPKLCCWGQNACTIWKHIWEFWLSLFRHMTDKKDMLQIRGLISITWIKMGWESHFDLQTTHIFLNLLGLVW